MKTIEMKCKKCGADLILDLDHLQGYCQYCGEKLLIDIENLQPLLIEKEKTKQTFIKEKTKRFKINNKNKSNEKYYDYKLEKSKLEFIQLIAIFLLPFIVIAICYFMGWLFINSL